MAIATAWVNGTGKAYVTTHFAYHGDYPKPLDDLVSGGVVEKADDLLDPWGQKYQYKHPGTHNPDSFDIWTTTPDGDKIGNWGSE